MTDLFDFVETYKGHNITYSSRHNIYCVNGMFMFDTLDETRKYIDSFPIANLKNDGSRGRGDN